MWPVSVSFIIKHFLFAQENFTQVRAFKRYTCIPLRASTSLADAMYALPMTHGYHQKKDYDESWGDIYSHLEWSSDDEI